MRTTMTLLAGLTLAASPAAQVRADEPGIAPAVAPVTRGVPLSALGRYEGWRENALIGYGLVVGLAGSGDSGRSDVTRQALQNVYARLGTTVSEADISSRNVAVVIVTARLPAAANVGDEIDITVSSAADARSLAGGQLLMTPLLGPDGQPYALAQGALVTGGDSFESELNRSQRNYPTTGRIEAGATVERSVNAHLVGADGQIRFFLYDPNFTTATRIASAINARFGYAIATADHADQVSIRPVGHDSALTAFIASLEEIRVEPGRVPRIVINERTGTIVAGGDVIIDSVVISQGDIRITVTAENTASQPAFISGFASDVSSLVVTNTELSVERAANDVVASFPNTTVADLVQGLADANVDTRRMISILQAVQSAGALHAEIIVQ
ncbi:flagellar basal body P-ring protein FlgI [Maricaulis sp. D1M11]|uniref:flagellar basal body P-ring protein FlgI n=1 Tax=Maricaulis sp. D1M11 TaxID=3076117 RepID=UPI0039B55A3C